MLKGANEKKVGISLQLRNVTLDRATKRAKKDTAFRSRTHFIEVATEKLLDELDKTNPLDNV